MVNRKKPGVTAPATRVTRSKAKATVSVEIEQPVPESSVRLASPISELSNKRRKTAKNDSATVRARAQKVSVQIATLGSNDSGAVSSASSVAYGGEEIDTPATTISTGSVCGGKRILKTVTERLGGTKDSDSVLTTRSRSIRFSQRSRILLDSDGEEASVEEHGEDTAVDLEEEDFQPSEDDSDEYAEVETYRRGKRRARVRAAPTASSSSSSTRLETIAWDDDSELSDVPDTEMEIDAGADSDEDEDEDDDDEGTGATGATVSAPIVNTRVPRYRRGVRMSRAMRQMEALYWWHPELRTVWDELDKRVKVQIQQDPQPEGLTLTMLPFQLEGLHWMRNQEKTDFGGGILADEMGMGKTIQTIALLMAEPRHKPNLVVAPTVALMQWRNEIEKHTANALSVTIFHGTNRPTDTKILKNCDVIMTTYSVLESMYRKQQHGFKRKHGTVKENSVLHKIQFHRVILDEAHNIKDRTCNTAKAVFALTTKHKLCLSGTPLQNRIGEFFSLLRFLEADPFSYYFCRKCKCKSLHWKFSNHRSCDDCKHRPMDHCNWFNAELLKPIQQYGNVGEGKTAFAKLRKILGHLMLRRTKVEKADDLGLPPRVVRIRRDYFNEEELDLYDSIYGESRRKFDTYVAQGVVLNNYANIFTLITRMRQLADHPDLVLRKHAEEGQNTLVCCICDDEAEDAIASKCRHRFCRLCVSKYIESYDGEGAPDCPQCHLPLSIDLSQPAIENFRRSRRGASSAVSI